MPPHIAFNACKLATLAEVFKLLDEYNVLDYILDTPSILNLTYKELVSRLNYLLSNNLDLIIDNRLNRIFRADDIRLKEYFNTTQEELIENYLYKYER